MMKLQKSQVLKRKIIETLVIFEGDGNDLIRFNDLS